MKKKLPILAFILLSTFVSLVYKTNISHHHVLYAAVQLPEDSLKIAPDFVVIKTHGLPPYEEVNRVFHISGLAEICDSLGIDQLDRDLMFMKTARTPYEQFGDLKLKDGSERAYKAIFPQDRLKALWIEARRVLKKDQ